MKTIPTLKIVVLSAMLLGAPLAAQAEDRAALAAQIINNSVSVAEKNSFEAAMLDTAARPLFKKLSKDPTWGPDHPGWKKHYPAFTAELAKAARRPLATVQPQLQRALADEMTEAELKELLAVLNSAEYRTLAGSLQSLGLDMNAVMQIVGMSGNEQLYSQAERDGLKTKLLAIKGREAEVLALAPKLESLRATVETPAFAKYQELAQRVLANALAKLESDPQFHNQMMGMYITWMDRVRWE